MNIQEKHDHQKAVSTGLLFKGEEGKTIALQILKNQELKEHITKTPAFLLCVNGCVVFENEKGFKEILTSGDYVNIEPMVKHWVVGLANSQLILVK